MSARERRREGGGEGRREGGGRAGGRENGGMEERSSMFSLTQAIEWEHIDYFNNAVICELIEHVSINNR